MNDYLTRLQATYKNGFHDGERCGQQQIIDTAMVYLTRKGWKGQEILDFFNGVNAIIDEYAAAWNPSQDQDVVQARLDGEIEYGLDGAHEFLEFRKRYPDVKNMGYDRPIKEERHPAAKKKGKRK